ncbi:MAG: four-carbon acid sugar kinase family protein [Lachnospiraceae bacterium]
MIHLLVIADDFTGALDTGVRFHPQETLVRVGIMNEDELKQIPEKIKVLIVDAETRHLQAEDAYNAIYHMVDAAKGAGISHIYKKTDSGLRGNIGSELTAILKASGQGRLHFIPAYPQQGRVTWKGIHYVDQIPVAESVFGQDPFEPVLYSKVKDIIHSQSNVNVLEADAEANIDLAEGIIVYDSQTDEDMKQVGNCLKKKNELTLLAGCAGFAAMLPELLHLKPSNTFTTVMNQKLFVVCGSVNPVTLKQIEYAEKTGAIRIKMSLKEKFQQDWLFSKDGKEYLEKLKKEIETSDCAILESASDIDEESTQEYAERLGISREDIRQIISGNLGAILEQLLSEGLQCTFLLTGGDTLLAFMKKIRLKELSPICELFPGVVLSEFKFKSKYFRLISKSGGFGEESLILDLSQMIKNNSEKGHKS